MNWRHWQKELSNLADDMSDTFQKLEDESKLPMPTLLLAESRWRSLIDDICTRYAETNSWPKEGMTLRYGVLIYFRVNIGAERADELALGQPFLIQSSAELDLERAEALKYLLVDYWTQGGRAKWLSS